jgi:hypothetical protein
MDVSRQRSDDKSMSTNYTMQVLGKLAEAGDRDAIVQGCRRISGREDIEIEPEVRVWLESLPNRQFGHVLAFAEKLTVSMIRAA